jgi:hypothetical protein
MFSSYNVIKIGRQHTNKIKTNSAECIIAHNTTGTSGVHIWVSLILYAKPEDVRGSGTKVTQKPVDLRDNDRFIQEIIKSATPPHLSTRRVALHVIHLASITWLLRYFVHGTLHASSLHPPFPLMYLPSLLPPPHYPGPSNLYYNTHLMPN